MAPGLGYPRRIGVMQPRTSGDSSDSLLSFLGEEPRSASEDKHGARLTVPNHRDNRTETRRTGGVSEAVLTTLIDAGFTGRMARVASEDSFIPLGDAAAAVLLSQEAIEEAARDLLS